MTFVNSIVSAKSARFKGKCPMANGKVLKVSLSVEDGTVPCGKEGEGHTPDVAVIYPIVSAKRAVIVLAWGLERGAWSPAGGMR